ncbi:uncharacterized protein LOC131641623 [Vicia villosa]|uniref:uncharacterized protein LOC131641623 n=1 Tax=Vicia villosa TaxID=3911 RepID=UPI00273C6F2F|nr:uncharacterized protein LOC131641623 [Vicia villosa]
MIDVRPKFNKNGLGFSPGRKRLTPPAVGFNLIKFVSGGVIQDGHEGAIFDAEEGDIDIDFDSWIRPSPVLAAAKLLWCLFDTLTWDCISRIFFPDSESLEVNCLTLFPIYHHSSFSLVQIVPASFVDKLISGRVMAMASLLSALKAQKKHYTHEFWSHKEGLRWPQKFMTLTNTGIFWSNNYFCRMKTLDCCGDFPNVPLIGTKGGISYSPVLSRRQFGFPMDKKPRNILLDELFLEEKVENKEFRERIPNAWHPSHRKEIKDWKKKGDLSPEPFESWIGSRAAELRMPYLPGTSLPPIKKRAPPVVSPLTIEELQEALKKMKKSRDHWKKKFEYS